MFPAGRRRGELCALSPARLHAQLRAGLESPRVRVPYVARCKSTPTTSLRTAAQARYRQHYRSAFGHRPGPTKAPWPYVLRKHPDTMSPADHADLGHCSSCRSSTSRERELGGFTLDRIEKRADEYCAPTDHPALTSACRSAIVVHHSLNRLKPRAISGEMPIPSGTGACDMRSTGIGTGAVFRHAAPHSDPLEVLPREAIPRRTDLRHHRVPPETYPAPNSTVDLDPSDYPQLRYPPSRATSTVQRREFQSGTDHPSRTIRSHLVSIRTMTRPDTPPLTLCRLRTPSIQQHRQPHLLAARQTDDPEAPTMVIAERSIRDFVDTVKRENVYPVYTQAMNASETPYSLCREMRIGIRFPSRQQTLHYQPHQWS